MSYKKKGYMCSTDWNHELGEGKRGTQVYPSLTAIREERECVCKCGIVEVLIEKRRVVQKTDFSNLKVVKDVSKNCKILKLKKSLNTSEGQVLWYKSRYRQLITGVE